MSAISPNQWTILEALEKGPRWARSFQTVKPLLLNLIQQGLIERRRPHLGRGANMVGLTLAGCAALQIDPATVPAKRDEPKPNSKVFKHVLGSIRSDASQLARDTCEAFKRSIDSGATSGQAVSHLAAYYDVQRPAIWKRLRDGGVIAPYVPRKDGGRGRPAGGGIPGYSADRRERSLAYHEQIEPRAPHTRVDRDPCPRCGTRGDIGCSHNRGPVGMTFG